MASCLGDAAAGTGRSAVASRIWVAALGAVALAASCLSGCSSGPDAGGLAAAAPSAPTGSAGRVCTPHACISVRRLARSVNVQLKGNVVGYMALVGRIPPRQRLGLRDRRRGQGTDQGRRPAAGQASSGLQQHRLHHLPGHVAVHGGGPRHGPSRARRRRDPLFHQLCSAPGIRSGGRHGRQVCTSPPCHAHVPAALRRDCAGDAGPGRAIGILAGTIPVVIATNSNGPALQTVVQTALRTATSPR